MNGAGVGAGAGCWALAGPANSAADAASATSAIRFMLVLPDFQRCATGVSDRRDGAPFGAACEYATFQAAGECALLGKEWTVGFPPKDPWGLDSEPLDPPGPLAQASAAPDLNRVSDVARPVLRLDRQ